MRAPCLWYILVSSAWIGSTIILGVNSARVCNSVWCYYVVEDPKSRPDAAKNCKLAEVSSYEIQINVERLLDGLQTAGAAWIGAEKTIVPDWQWIDGTPVELEKSTLCTGDNGDYRSSFCGALRTVGEESCALATFDCAVEKPVVCFIRGDRPTCSKRENSVSLKNRCYFIPNETPSWFSAEHTCLQNDGHLLNETSRELFVGIGKLISSSLNLDHNEYWVGATKGYIWQWENSGNRVVYSNWNTAVAPLPRTFCMKMTEGSGLWTSGICNSEKHPFICQVPSDGNANGWKTGNTQQDIPDLISSTTISNSVDQSDNTTHQSEVENNTTTLGIIVGAVAAVVVMVLILVAVILAIFIRRRRKRRLEYLGPTQGNPPNERQTYVVMQTQPTHVINLNSDISADNESDTDSINPYAQCGDFIRVSVLGNGNGYTDTLPGQASNLAFESEASGYANIGDSNKETSQTRRGWRPPAPRKPTFLKKKKKRPEAGPVYAKPMKRTKQTVSIPHVMKCGDLYAQPLKGSTNTLPAQTQNVNDYAKAFSRVEASGSNTDEPTRLEDNGLAEQTEPQQSSGPGYAEINVPNADDISHGPSVQPPQLHSCDHTTPPLDDPGYAGVDFEQQSPDENPMYDSKFAPPEFASEAVGGYSEVDFGRGVEHRAHSTVSVNPGHGYAEVDLRNSKSSEDPLRGSRSASSVLTGDGYAEVNFGQQDQLDCDASASGHEYADVDTSASYNSEAVRPAISDGDRNADINFESQENLGPQAECQSSNLCDASEPTDSAGAGYAEVNFESQIDHVSNAPADATGTREDLEPDDDVYGEHSYSVQ